MVSGVDECVRRGISIHESKRTMSIVICLPTEPDQNDRMIGQAVPFEHLRKLLILHVRGARDASENCGRQDLAGGVTVEGDDPHQLQ